MSHDDSLKPISKFLSFVLRHDPQSIGLRLDSAGWASIDELLAKAGAAGQPMDRALLQRVVDTSDKQRFAISADATRIRAQQGHSVPVDLGLSAAAPPDLLYHGSATRFTASILTSGLNRGQRHHVHLSEDRTTAAAVGRRYGKLVMWEIDAKRMAKDAHLFFRSGNGVWLTDAVPATYLRLLP